MKIKIFGTLVAVFLVSVLAWYGSNGKVSADEIGIKSNPKQLSENVQVEINKENAKVINLGEVHTTPDKSLLDIIREVDPSPDTPKEKVKWWEKEPQNEIEAEIFANMKKEMALNKQFHQYDEKLENSNLTKEERANNLNKRNEYWDKWVEKNKANAELMEKYGYAH